MFRNFAIALATTTALTAPAALLAGSHSMDIVDTAQDAGSFSTLLAAAEAAGLVETLKGEGPLTVFAPTDEAFAALPEGTVESLLEPENKDKLAQILTYHVVSGSVMSGDLSDGMTAATVEGGEITVALGDGVMVNDANVVTPDIEASNGVIHVIDKVLMPDAAM
ncbi:MAG: fasciclin domain-containing protein [Pseudooceanicola sp.]